MAHIPITRSPERETTGRLSPVRSAIGSIFRTVVFMHACILVAQAQDATGLEGEVKYGARDSMRYDAKEQTVYLFGAATVSYQDLVLTADRIRYSFKNEQAEAFGAPDSTGTVRGKPVFNQGGQEFDADSIRYSFRSKQGFIREVRTHEQESWLHASMSKRLANGEVHSRGGMLTTCDRPKPHYHFKVSRMIVIPDDKIIAGPAYMKIGRVPTPLAIPFGFFPNRPRGSAGILVPIWGESEQLGFYLLNGGYYLPLGDRADFMLTGDVYSRGSWAANARSRYKVRYRYSGSLDLSHNTLLNSDPKLPDFSRTRSYFVRWNHLVDPKASLSDRFNASVNLGSSNNFTNNFNSSNGDYLTNTFQSNIGWNHLWPGRPYNLAVNLRHSQNSQTRRFEITAPSISFNVARFFPLQLLRRDQVAISKWTDRIGLSYSASFDNRLSTTEERLYWANLPTLPRELQNGIRHTAAISTSFKTSFLTINPEIRLTDRMYFENLRTQYDAGVDGAVSDTLPGFSAPFDWSAGATFTSKVYGMYQFRGERLKAIRHVLTPSAGFSYRPDFGSQVDVFRPDGTLLTTYSPYDIGIYGKPPSGESGLVTLGLVQSLEAKVKDRKAAPDAKDPTRKIKLLDVVSVTTSYDMLRDSLRWSPLGVAARTMLFNLVNVNVNSTWDPYAVDALGNRFDQGALGVNGRLLRLTNANAAIGFELKSPKYGQSTNAPDPDGSPVVGEADPNKGARLNFSLPWRVNINYSYDVFRSWLGNDHLDIERQSVLFNGDITVLKWWKLGATSGYDVTAGDWTPTSLNLYWDLHCWEFNFNVIPIGVRKSYSFRINVKASILSDLKYERIRPIGTDGDLLF